jgi:hypothetical protein
MKVERNVEEDENDNEPWWCRHVDFCYNKNQRILATSNKGTMLFKTLIHQECHVKIYGMEKLQMGSNLKHIKKTKVKTKTQQNKSFVIVAM